MEWVYKFSRVTTESPGASLSLNSGIFSEEISFENGFVGHGFFLFFFFFERIMVEILRSRIVINARRSRFARCRLHEEFYHPLDK